MTKWDTESAALVIRHWGGLIRNSDFGFRYSDFPRSGLSLAFSADVRDFLRWHLPRNFLNRPSPTPEGANFHARAAAPYRAGDKVQAERLCDDALRHEPLHPDSI